MPTRPGPGPIPQLTGYTDLRRLPGGHTHEMYVGRAVGDPRRELVIRVFGSGTRRRGPEAPGVQSAVLRLGQGLLPVPEPVEVRREDVDGVSVLVTTFLPGVPLAGVLKDASPELQHRLGTSMGTVLGRMAGMATIGPGCFLDDQLTLGPWPAHSESLVTWLDHLIPGSALADLTRDEQAGLYELAPTGDALLAVSRRGVLTHGDLSPRNLLCDPVAGVITGVIDWEFARAGHPLEDLGKLLRRIARTPFVDATIDAMTPTLPGGERADRETLRTRARAADFYWLIEVASRRGQSPATEHAWKLLRRMGRTRQFIPEDR